MACDPDQQVESLLDGALKHGNFQAMEEFLLDETREGKTSNCSRQFISKLNKLINRELDRRNVKNASIVFTILHKLGDNLIFPGGEGISAMVSQGLVRKWFEKVRMFWIEAGPMRNEVMINLAEDFFDVLMVVHESSKEGTYQVTESFLHHIGKLAADAKVNIMIQKEAVRKLNAILGKIPGQLKKEKKILSSQEAYSVMDDLSCQILKGGDYDLQVALMEALCRMTSSAQRRELADRWFSMEFVASAFRNIQDSEFETDCRKFLNLVNGMQGDGRSVYSYPCLEVFLDKHVLLMPVDENLKEFWIDFNLGSQSISFYFCLADQAQEGQWDTLCITENEIYSYTVEEEEDVKVLQLVLTEPVCVSNIEGSRLTIHFSSCLDVLQATKKVYGEAKNKKFIGKSSTSVVKTTVQIILDEGNSQVLFPESQVSSEPIEKTVSVKNSTPLRSLPYERNAQHHNQQTVTPLRSKLSESCMYVSGSAGRKLGRSPFSCVIPAIEKVKVKPSLEMVASSERKKESELRELLLAKSSHRVSSIIEDKENIRKQAIVPHLMNEALTDRRDCQEAERYRRHIPVDKVLEMVHADQEFEERPLDTSIVPDSQPAMRNESMLPGLCHFVKNKRISVSGSLLPCLKELSHSELGAPAGLSTELPQQLFSVPRSGCGSGVLTHKELHTQLTQRLKQVLRERELQGEPSTAVSKEISLGQSMSKSVKISQKSTPAKLLQCGQAKSNRADTSREVKTAKAADIVKQISSHYKNAAPIKAAPETDSSFNIPPASRHLFSKSWYPASAVKIAADTSEFQRSRSQSKKTPNENKDVFEFSKDIQEVNRKKCRRTSEISGMESSVFGNSLTLSDSSKKCPPAKTAGRYVKKHLFSDTDTENMTEVSWLKSANRRPKPKVADYTRQPVKVVLPPGDTTFETPNIHLSSLKAANVLPKPKKKRQKKVLERKDKKSQNVASRKPTGRPQRAAAQTKSYIESSDSGNESDAAEPPPAKKLIIKKTEKPQRRDMVQTKGQVKNKDKTSSEAMFAPAVKENNNAKSKAFHNVMKEKVEREFGSPEQSKKKNKAAAPMEVTNHNIQNESSSTKIASPTSTYKTRSGEKRAALASAPFISLGLFSKSESLQKKASVQTKMQTEKNDQVASDGVTVQLEIGQKHPGETIKQSDTDNALMEKKEVSKLLGPGKSKNKNSAQQSAKEQKKCWAPTLPTFSPSHFSIEKMRSADKSTPLTKSSITPIPLPPLSPAGAVSPSLELPSHLKGIQASSFYKTPVRQHNVNLPLTSSFTPDAKKQSAEEVSQDTDLSPMPSMAQPLITSTGRRELACSSLLNSPDLEEDMRGFLNSASHRSLQASFDNESVISLVTLSQSSHKSVNRIAMICTNLEKTPEFAEGYKSEKATFQSGPSTHWKQLSSCKSVSLSEIEDSEEEGETKVLPRELAIKMKPRKLFKPNDKPRPKKKAFKQLKEVESSSEEERKEERDIGKKRRFKGVDKKFSNIPQSPRPTAEDVEMHSTLSNMVSSCWEVSVEADTERPQSEFSNTQDMGFVCHQFSTELKKKFENHSRRMDLFNKKSLKLFKQHMSSVSMQVHKYRSQRLEKVKQVLMDEIKSLEQDDAALHNMEEELASHWKKQALAFHAYQESGSRRLYNLKSAIETNVCHGLEYEEQIFSSEVGVMKKDMKSVQDRLLRQMQEEDLLSVRRGLQTLFLPDVPMF